MGSRHSAVVGRPRKGDLSPDLVAPGTSIFLMLAQRSDSAHNFWNVHGPRLLLRRRYQHGHPAGGGCVAMVREALVKNGLANPTAARIKALLINGAVTIPANTTPLKPVRHRIATRAGAALTLLDSSFYQAQTPTAAWRWSAARARARKYDHDPRAQSPGILAKPALGLLAVPFAENYPRLDRPARRFVRINHFDLIVRTSNGQERHGNMGTSSNFDRVNNVEQVVWDNIPTGDVRITIRAFHITQFPQSFLRTLGASANPDHSDNHH